MTQRYWTIYTPDEWSTSTIDEWDTLLLEPNGITGVVQAASDAATVTAVGTVKHTGAVGAASLSCTVIAEGSVTPKTKTGGVYAVSGSCEAATLGIVGRGGSVTAVSSQSSVVAAGQRGSNGTVVAVSGPCQAGTPTGLVDGLVDSQSSPCEVVATGSVKTHITGTVNAVSGECATFAAGSHVVIVSAVMVESFLALNSAFNALHGPIDVTMQCQNSNLLARITGSAHTWAVKRRTNEIDLFLDDREIILDVGSYQ